MSVSINFDHRPPQLPLFRRWTQSIAGSLLLLLPLLEATASGAQQQPRSVTRRPAPKATVMADKRQIKKMPLEATPEDDRLRTTPTAWWWYHGVSPEFIADKLKQNGARIVDLEIESTSPRRFSVVMVKNEGAYAASWWWYYGLRGVGAAAAKINEHEQARLVDIEAMEVDYGDGKGPEFAIVLVGNSGAHERSWWRSINDPLDSIKSSIDDHDARLVDLEYNQSTVIPGRYGAVLLANEGADARAWWWYLGVSPDFITARLQEHGARLVDIDPLANGKFNVVMVKGSGESWWWYYGLTADALADRLSEHGARLIDIEPYRVGGAKRFAAIMLEN